MKYFVFMYVRFFGDFGGTSTHLINRLFFII